MKELIIRIPDHLEEQLRKQPNINDFVVNATQTAIDDQILAQRLAKSAAQADRGEYADPKDLEAFFEKWKTDDC